MYKLQVTIHGSKQKLTFTLGSVTDARDPKTLDMYTPFIMLISWMRDSLEQPQTNLMDDSYTVQILYSLLSTLIIAILDINQHDLLQENSSGSKWYQSGIF